jgi:hypothetical protein
MLPPPTCLSYASSKMSIRTLFSDVICSVRMAMTFA